jgi:type IV pilus assembly protein PilQ
MRTRSLSLLLAACAMPVAAPLALFAQPAAQAVPPQPAPAAADKPAVLPPVEAPKIADKPAAPEVAVKGEEPAKPIVIKDKESASKDTLTVDFPDTDIRDILRNVADLFELNIIMPETLQGKTTIKLRNVTWRQIFENVLKPANYTYIEDGNIIKIVSNESLQQEPTTTEIFLINYAKATDISPTISSLVDAAAGGKIVVDARSNSLVITERPTRFKRIKPIIEQLDRATDQVMIESKFVEVTNNDVKNIGVDWSSLNGYKIGVSGNGTNGAITSTFDRNRGQTNSATSGINTQNTTTSTNSNTVNNTNGTTTNQTSGSNTTNSVTSTNGVPTATSTTGTNGALSTTNNVANTVTGITGGGADLSSTQSLLTQLVNTDGTSRVLSSVFSAAQFQLVLNALQSQNDVKIVSNPTIVTLNNKEATINVGQEQPIPRYQYNQQTGSFEVSGFDYKPIGVNLKVTPQVNARGSIKLVLDPEVSQTNGFLTFGPAQIPIVASRKTHTEVSIRDGYTMGIGGLLTSQTTKGVTKVPLLGSIPGLGQLFRSDSTNKQGTNLIIFITAKTVNADGAPTEQIFESGRVRELEMKREDLPGYRDGSDPFLSSSPAKPAKKP